MSNKPENIDEELKRSINYNTIMLTIGFVGLFTIISAVKDGINLKTMTEISFYTLVSLGLFISWEIFNMLISAAKGIWPDCIGSPKFRIFYTVLWVFIFLTVIGSLIKVSTLLFPALYLYFTSK
jgi:hypothetical protein